jgi:hypothetical protein
MKGVATYHEVNSFMKPPSNGPRGGPMKGDIVNSIIGGPTLAGTKRSDTVPAATDKKALPASPPRNRPTRIVCMFRPTAQGMLHSRKKDIDII